MRFAGLQGFRELVNAGAATASRALRSVARTVRRVPERVAHPWRQRSAVRRLSRRPPPQSVLVVCHGNICRSPTLPRCCTAAYGRWWEMVFK